MEKVNRVLWTAFLACLPLSCQTNDQVTGDEPIEAGVRELALDNVEEPPEDMSLLSLGREADWREVADLVEDLGGQVFHVLPPRFIAAQVPAAAKAIFQDHGVEARFSRAVGEEDFDALTDAQRSFLRVFSSRYYSDELPPQKRIQPTFEPVENGEPWETEAESERREQADAALKAAAATDSIEDDIEAERSVYVPYAAGTIAVSVWLPESNGAAEPSTEDWTQEQILEVYAKIQSALEAVKRHEPQSGLRFVMHYESAPGRGGLTGTIDHDWEFGKQANWGAGNNENRSKAQILGRLLDREVGESETWFAMKDYVNRVRDMYAADGVFVVIVGANGNGTAGLRAHASINGPSTTLHSLNSWRVFMHEFGHIFGATDEYCPDACRTPTATQGYLSAINANATYKKGSGVGINDGQGENQPSLMMYNVVNAVNGYTRGAWGWLDVDGDGIVDVRDTSPRSRLEATELDGEVFLTGWIVDVPAARRYGSGFSVNRIEALEYRFADVEGCPWFEIPVHKETRGRQRVELNLGALPAGRHAIEVRAVNSVGNVELAPRTLFVEATGAGSAPHVKLDAALAYGSVASEFSLTLDAFDLDDDSLELSLDLDGDGVFERPVPAGADIANIAVSFDEPGSYLVGARAVDAHGNEAIATKRLLVFDKNAPPKLELAAAAGNPVNGNMHVAGRFDVASYEDPDGDEVLLNWIVEIAGQIGDERRVETGFGDSASFTAEFQTPLSLRQVALNPFGDDKELVPELIRDIAVVGDEMLAFGLGHMGIALVDIADREAPVIASRLGLETAANHLHVRGDRLYVLGGQLAIVDIADPYEARELKQLWTQTHVRTQRRQAEAQIWTGSKGARHEFWFEHDEKIDVVQVKVAVRLEQNAIVNIELFGDKSNNFEPVRLLERQAMTAGRHVLSFNSRNTPELAELRGRFGGGNWAVAVNADPGDGVVPGPAEPNLVGVLEESRVRLRTKHNAAPVLPSPQQVVGVMGEGYVVVAGEGLQVIDAFIPEMAREIARLEGDPLVGAELVGSTVVGMTLADPKKKKDAWSHLFFSFWPRVEGLFAVDLSLPFLPYVLRMEEDYAGYELIVVGSRFYARRPNVEPEGSDGPREVTTVGSVDAFMGSGAWELGHTPLRVMENAFGDDREVYTIGGGQTLVSLDVSDPRDIRVAKEYLSPQMSRFVRLGDRELVSSSWDGVFTVDLDDVTSTLSRVYTVTCEAKDSAGAITRQVRNVHVIPYAHPPRITGFEVLSGRDSEDDWQLKIDIEDEDGRPSWDPHMLVQADFDSDGIWDTPWSWSDAAEAVVYHRFPNPGVFDVTFRVRDGFWGLSNEWTATVEVPAKVEVPCGGEYGDTCQKDEYCFVETGDTCSDQSEGLCTRRSSACEKKGESWVCGCDGRDYYNECDAMRSGVNIAHEGRCPDIECAANEECPKGQFCRFETYKEPELTCGGAGPGTCEPTPEFCYILMSEEQTMPIRRVLCGCDGQEYRSECEAHRVGVSIMKYESCEPPPPTCQETGCKEGDICMMCFGGYVCMPKGAMC